MSQKTRLAFTLFDAVVLVAATAVGMAGTRACLLITVSPGQAPQRPRKSIL